MVVVVVVVVVVVAVVVVESAKNPIKSRITYTATAWNTPNERTTNPLHQDTIRPCTATKLPFRDLKKVPLRESERALCETSGKWNGNTYHSPHQTSFGVAS